MRSLLGETLTIRRARAQDAAAVARLERLLPASGGWSEAQLSEEAARSDSLFIVALKGPIVAGYLVARIEAGELRVHTVGVAPELLRRGVARAVLSYALERAKEAGCSKAALEVSAANAPALALYAAAGFSIVGRRPKFYNDGSDALLMDLPL